MDKIEIITNNQPRNMVYGMELTEVERKDFDYIDPEELDSHDFFRYKGQLYDPGEFMRVPEQSPLTDWQGVAADTFFSGVLIRYTDDCEQVIVGRYYS